MAFTNLNAFNRELQQFSDEQLPRELVTLHKRISLEALQRIVNRSPVDTGRFRAAWITAVGETAALFLSLSGEAAQSTGDPINRGLQALRNLKPFSVVSISNNVRYGEFLERGSSKQAPRGVVDVTFEELRTIFR